MIDRLGELMRWTRTPLTSGGVILAAPGAPAVVRIQPNLRPLQSLRSLVATRWPDATLAGRIQRIVSDGGEYAALVSLRVNAPRAHTRVIGIAIGDDTYTLIEGIGDRIERVVELLLRSQVHGHGFDRARMIPYRVASGWSGVRRTLATCWFAPRYPRDPARLVVCDAIPIASLVAATQELLWPCEPPPHATSTPIERAPLSGRLVQWARDGAVTALAELGDGTFRYRVQLHGGNAGTLAVLRDVVASLEPVPRPLRSTALAAADVFGWLT